jgi:hypothetical protein
MVIAHENAPRGPNSAPTPWSSRVNGIQASSQVRPGLVPSTTITRLERGKMLPSTLPLSRAAGGFVIVRFALNSESGGNSREPSGRPVEDPRLQGLIKSGHNQGTQNQHDQSEHLLADPPALYRRPRTFLRLARDKDPRRTKGAAAPTPKISISKPI